MFGCYKINFLDKKKTIYQKNSITDEGRKKILDMLSYNPTTTFGYKKADISNGIFELNGKICHYKTSFFGWGEVSHPFNPSNSSYSTLAEVEVNKQVLTENGNLSENQADRILKNDNSLRVDWGRSNYSDYLLNTYKVWFNIGIGMVDWEEKFELPLPEETNTIINADNEIKLFGNPIYPKSVTLISEKIPNAKPYIENIDYSIDYENGILKILNKELRKNLYIADEENPEGTNVVEKNIVKITYTWNGARYIDELKNGICGVYINAQPSIKIDSSSKGNNNYFGMGTFSFDNGKTWEGYSFPWKGTPLKNLSNNEPCYGKNFTAFYSNNSEFEHFFPTFPYTFINPTNFAFAFKTDGTSQFQIKNFNFLVPEFPPFSLQEIGIVSSEREEIKKSIEWSGINKDENDKFFAEWKIYLDADEANDVNFKFIRTYYNDNMNNIKDGWNEIEYPKIGDIMFSEAEFTEEWTKNENDMIEISYRIYFSEVENETKE